MEVLKNEAGETISLTGSLFEFGNVQVGQFLAVEGADYQVTALSQDGNSVQLNVQPAIHFASRPISPPDVTLCDRWRAYFAYVRHNNISTDAAAILSGLLVIAEQTICEKSQEKN